MKFEVHCAPSVTVGARLDRRRPGRRPGGGARRQRGGDGQRSPAPRPRSRLRVIALPPSDSPGPHARSVRRPYPTGRSVKPLNLRLERVAVRCAAPWATTHTAIIRAPSWSALVVAVLRPPRRRLDDDSSTPAVTTTSTAQAADENGQGGAGVRGRQARGRRRLRRGEVATIVIKNGQPEGGVAELSFTEGEDIRFRVSRTSTRRSTSTATTCRGRDRRRPVEFDVPATSTGCSRSSSRTRRRADRRDHRQPGLSRVEPRLVAGATAARPLVPGVSAATPWSAARTCRSRRGCSPGARRSS